MNQQLASQGGVMNSFKWVIVVLLVILGVVGNFHFADKSLLIRVIGLLGLTTLAAVVALQTNNGKRFWRFAQDSRNELRKVVWPNRQETLRITLMVLGVVAIVGIILWGVDIILLKIVAWLTGYGAF